MTTTIIVNGILSPQDIDFQNLCNAAVVAILANSRNAASMITCIAEPAKSLDNPVIEKYAAEPASPKAAMTINIVQKYFLKNFNIYKFMILTPKIK